ncbi:hypothetical protein DFS34DRAFT_192758 [Phlyctochytrium arcticum]|nr:hypothetical protein DFS34DRAFT_192758 [Phlyctochytrium arcticum]
MADSTPYTASHGILQFAGDELIPSAPSILGLDQKPPTQAPQNLFDDGWLLSLPEEDDTSKREAEQRENRLKVDWNYVMRPTCFADFPIPELLKDFSDKLGPSAVLNAIELLYSRKEYSAAYSLCSSYLDLNEKRPKPCKSMDVTEIMIRCAIKLGDLKGLEKMAEPFKKSREPNHKLLLSEIYKLTGQPLESALMIAEYLKLRPDDPTAYRSLAKVLPEIQSDLQPLSYLCVHQALRLLRRLAKDRQDSPMAKLHAETYIRTVATELEAYDDDYHMEEISRSQQMWDVLQQHLGTDSALVIQTGIATGSNSNDNYADLEAELEECRIEE